MKITFILFVVFASLPSFAKLNCITDDQSLSFQVENNKNDNTYRVDVSRGNEQYYFLDANFFGSQDSYRFLIGLEEFKDGPLILILACFNEGTFDNGEVYFSNNPVSMPINCPFAEGSERQSFQCQQTQ